MRKLLLYAALLLLTQCSKCKDDDPSPLEQLPSATQTGANTFGCLVNGQAWTPQGYSGAANYSVSYDRIATGGVLDVRAYRIYGKTSTESQYINLFARRIAGPGNYSLRNPQDTKASYDEVRTNCYWSTNDSATTYRRGTLTITKLDLTSGIIAGTFDFTLYKPGCDSIRVTHGRFDKKM